MRPVVYDAGVLVAADRNERRTWADHRVRLEMGIIPVVPAPVVAQVSRSHRQAQLRRFLMGCEVAPFAENDAHEAGRLLAASKTSDVVDAAIVELAMRRQADVVTSDPHDIEKLARAARASLRIVGV